MSKATIELGRAGEQEAVNFLKRKGYAKIITNYRNSLGQIDIVARDKKTICFIEVKARRSRRFGQPVEAVTDSKQRKISQVALLFLKQNGLLSSSARFDVISISYLDIRPEIKLVKNAFDLDYRYFY